MIDKYIERQWAKHIAKMQKAEQKAEQKAHIVWLSNHNA